MDIVITVEWAIAGLSFGYGLGTLTAQLHGRLNRYRNNRNLGDRMRLAQLLDTVRDFNSSHDCAVMWTDIRPIETAEVKH